MHAITLMDLFLLEESVAQPLDTKNLIRQGKNAIMIAKITILALEAFQRGELKKFDALVGEEACQLRAKKILDLYESSVDTDPVLEEAKRVAALFSERIGHTPTRKCSYVEAFGRDHLVVSPNIRFIVLAYLLTQTKKEVQVDEQFYNIKDRTDLTFLRETYDVSNAQLKSIRDQAQIQLANLSVDYVQSLGEPLPEKQLNSRRCVPCFDAIDRLLNSMIQKNQKLLIEVKIGNNPTESIGKIQQVYAPNETKTGFIELPISEVEPETPLVIFSGYSVTENSLEKHQIELSAFPAETLILASAAQHSSFPAGIEDSTVKEHPNRARYKDFAINRGCTPNNRRLFCLDHIYSSTLKKELETC